MSSDLQLVCSVCKSEKKVFLIIEGRHPNGRYRRIPRCEDHLCLVPIPQRIALLIAEDAVKGGEICPISLNPITIENSSVTSCFHIFEKASAKIWFDSHNICPICKQLATITEV